MRRLGTLPALHPHRWRRPGLPLAHPVKSLGGAMWGSGSLVLDHLEGEKAAVFYSGLV